jgi:L-asparagine permease
MTATEYDTSALAHEEAGYHEGLKPRRLQMIAIGTGLG